MRAKEIREILAEEFNAPADHDFFSLCYEKGETADEALERLFREERACHGPERSDLHIVKILAHG